MILVIILSFIVLLLAGSLIYMMWGASKAPQEYHDACNEIDAELNRSKK